MGFFKLIPPPFCRRRFHFFTWRTPYSRFSSSSAAAAAEVAGTSSGSHRIDQRLNGSPKKPPFRQSHGLGLRREELDSSPDISFRRASLRKSPQAYAEALLKLALQGNDSARELEVRVKEMGKIDPPATADVLGSLISRLCSERRLSDALRIFKAACSEGLLPPISVCNELMSSFSAEQGDLNSVVFVYKEIVKSGIAVTVETLNCLIAALFLAGHVDSAMDQFRRMNRKGCAPNSKTFETVISNLCAHGRIQESSEALDEMIGCSCKPDPDLFANIVPVFCNFNRSTEAKKLLQMMRTLDIPPDSSIYSDLIRCSCENGDLDDAANLLEEMSERLDSNNIPVGQPYNAMLKAYCRERRFQDAADLLKKMLAKGVEDDSSWNLLLTAVSLDSRKPRKTSSVLGKMIISGYIPDESTFSSLISGFSKAGEIKNAMLCFQHLLSRSWDMDSASFSDLIQALCHENMIHDAMIICRYMSGRTDHHSIPQSMLDQIISHMIQSGFINEAIKLRPTRSSTAVGSIIIGLMEINRPDLARILFSQTVVEDCPLDGRTYCLLIRAMITENGKNDDAIILLEQMVQRNRAPDQETIIFVLNCFKTSLQMKKLIRIFDKLVDQGPGLSSSAYNLLIRRLLKEGFNHEACKFLNQMLERGWVPDAETHGLLVGGSSRERKSKLPERENADDSLTSLLAEGLTNTNESILVV